MSPPGSHTGPNYGSMSTSPPQPQQQGPSGSSPSKSNKTDFEVGECCAGFCGLVILVLLTSSAGVGVAGLVQG